MRNKIKNLYNKVLIEYVQRPHNYVSPYIRRNLTDDEIRLIEQQYNFPFNESLYRIVFDIDSTPKCKICNNDLKFQGFTHGYGNFCSSICSHNSIEYRELISKINRGKSKSTKGKTYKEIFGDKQVTCGFKRGVDNPNYNPILKKKANDSLRKYYRNHPEAIQKKSREASDRVAKGNFHGKLKYKNSIDQKFRSSLEVRFSEFLLRNNLSYQYEVPFKLVNGRNKIVDFVIEGFLLVEVSGYAFESWKKDFDKKLRLLRQSTDKPILILTYPTQVLELHSRNFINPDFYIDNIEDESHILRGIKFYKTTEDINKRLEEYVENC